jgi:hypothetical protein
MALNDAYPIWYLEKGTYFQRKMKKLRNNLKKPLFASHKPPILLQASLLDITLIKFFNG